MAATKILSFAGESRNQVAEKRLRAVDSSLTDRQVSDMVAGANLDAFDPEAMLAKAAGDRDAIARSEITRAHADTQVAKELANKRQIELEADQKRSRQKTALTREQISGDIREGVKLGEELIPEGFLGRMGERSEIKSSMARLQDLSQGMGAKETEARRAQAFEGIDQATGSQSRALQASLARAGVKGGVAGAQLRDTAIGGIQAKSNVERDLFLQDRSARVAGLDRLTKAQGAVASFDIGKQAEENKLKLQSGVLFAGIGASERGGSLASKTAIESAKLSADASAQAAASQSGGGGMSVVCTELHRQGILSDSILAVNTEFGKDIIANEPETFSAYLLWGKPMAKLMKKSPVATRILAPLMSKCGNYINGDKSLSNAILFHTLMVLTKGVGKVIKLLKSKETKCA